MRLLYIIVVIYFAAECTYKIWWYASGGTKIPHYGNIYLSDTIACILEVCSWLYRTTIFFLVCVLFQLICFLQILRLEDFAQVFQQETEVGLILIEHLSIRRNLRIISHRFRAFMLLSLLMVTASQLAALLMTTRASSEVNVFKAGELAVIDISHLYYQFETNQYIDCASYAAVMLHKPYHRTHHMLAQCNEGDSQGTLYYWACCKVACLRHNKLF